MDYAIGLDIGVTNVKCVCATREGEVRLSESAPTMAGDPSWPQRIRQRVSELEAKMSAAARRIGIAAPGLARPDGRCIDWMQGRLGEVEGLDWSAFLGRPVPVLNDAQSALLGEVWKGAAAGATNVIMLTLGTGVGGAAMVDGRLLRGHIGRAGHMGHVSLDCFAEPDIVGAPGSLESAIGNCTIGQRTGGRFASTHDLIFAVAHGDEEARRTWLRSIRFLACGVASMINVLDPEIVIIGGGIAAAGDLLFDPLRAELDQVEWRPHGRRARVVAAQLGEFAGALGAACNAMREETEETS
jgi:glucokinase